MATTVYLTAKQRKAFFRRGRNRRTCFSAELREAIDLHLHFPPDFDKESLTALAKEAKASLHRSMARGSPQH